MGGGDGAGRSWLGVPLRRPRAAFVELTSCEGCQLQVLNDEGSLPDFLSLLEVVDFREVMTGRSEGCDVAFVEGSVTREDEAERLRELRRRAPTLVAFGACACLGGVNRLRDRFGDLAWVKERVYGPDPVDTAEEVLPVHAVVPVDFRIHGCPVRKEELERLVLHLALGRTFDEVRHPVCFECKALGHVCLYDLGEPCLGPVTRGGCRAWCPGSRCGCWGCRGPVEDGNVEAMVAIMEERGVPPEAVLDRLECFGGFGAHAAALRERIGRRGS